MADDDEATPPGWYREQDDPGGLRWWDGDEWTDDTMPAPDTANVRAKRSRGTSTTRTRRDAMAEAEADVSGVRIAHAVATGTGDDALDGPPPIEILLEPQADPGSAASATATATAPEAGASARRRPAPAEGDSPLGRPTSRETVRLLSNWDDADPDADGPRPARHRAPGSPTRGPRRAGPAAGASGPSPRPTPRPSAGGAPDPARRGARLAAAPSPAAAATLLRVLVRAGLIALAVGVLWFAYVTLRDADQGDADTLSAEPRTAVVDAEAPRLDDIVLRLADLPRGWTAIASDPSNDDICDGRAPRSVLEPTGAVGAAFTSDTGALISNVVHEFVDVDTAKAFMDLTARVIDSCREYGGNGSTVRLSPLEFPKLGQETFAAAASGESPSGALHGAIVYVRHGHRVAAIQMLSTGADGVDTELLRHLTQLADRRMAAKRAISSGRPSGGSGGELPGE